MIESMIMKSIKKHIGTVFIILSLLVFGLFAFPILKAYLITQPVTLKKIPYEEFVLTIPKIRAQSLVIQNVDPWNQEAYNAALKKGIAHAAGTAMPGDGKTVFLFAHSSGPPWEQLASNTVFLRLGELEEADIIILDNKGNRYPYRVTAKKEVWPNEVRFLEDTSQNQLILQTCTPIGTTLKRLLIFAEPVTKPLVETKNQQ